MIPTVPQSGFIKWSYRAYVLVFFIYLALPLTVVCVFAFNNSVFNMYHAFNPLPRSSTSSPRLAS